MNDRVDANNKPAALSPNYAKVKRHFEEGLWTAAMVQQAVSRWITAEEAERILRGEQEDGGAYE